MSQISNFDPALFLDITLTEPTEKRAPLPVDDYTAVIGEVTPRAWQGRQDPNKSGMSLDVLLVVDVPAELQAASGLPPTLTLKDGIRLDLTPGGGIDNGKGKNRQLRAYREALNMNKPGDVFSPRMMQGQVVRIKVTHEIYQDAPVERVSGVTMAS
jgi:hypothetical protein